MKRKNVMRIECSCGSSAGWMRGGNSKGSDAKSEDGTVPFPKARRQRRKRSKDTHYHHHGCQWCHGHPMKEVVEDLTKKIIRANIDGSGVSCRCGRWLPLQTENNESSNSLPALIQVGPEPAFYDLLVENERLVDVAPYLEKDPEWKAS